MAINFGGADDAVMTTIGWIGLESYLGGAARVHSIHTGLQTAFDKTASRAQRLDSLGNGLIAFGSGAAAALVGLGMTSLRTAGQMEQIEGGMKTMLGSAEAARAKIGELQTFAKETPFDFLQSAQGAQRLLAMGIAAKDVVPYMNAMGNAVAAAGGDTNTFNRVILAIGQMQAKGRLMGDEMLQLTEAGIPAARVLQEELGLTADQMRKVGEQGISAAVAIPALMRGFEKMYGGAMKNQMDTLPGQMSMVGDSVNQLQTSIGKMFSGEAMSGLKFFSSTIDKTRDFVDAHPTGVKIGLEVAGGAALALIAGGGLLKYVAGLKEATNILRGRGGGMGGLIGGTTATMNVSAGVVNVSGGLGGFGGGRTGPSALATERAMNKLAEAEMAAEDAAKGLPTQNFPEIGLLGALRGLAGTQLGGLTQLGGKSVTYGGAALGAGLGIGAGIGAHTDLAAAGYTSTEADVGGLAVGTAAAATAMFVPGGAVAVALAEGFRLVFNKLYNEPMEREAIRTDMDSQAKMSSETSAGIREQIADLQRRKEIAAAEGDAATADALQLTQRGLERKLRAKDEYGRTIDQATSGNAWIAEQEKKIGYGKGEGERITGGRNAGVNQPQLTQRGLERNPSNNVNQPQLTQRGLERNPSNNVNQPQLTQRGLERNPQVEDNYRSSENQSPIGDANVASQVDGTDYGDVSWERVTGGSSKRLRNGSDVITFQIPNRAADSANAARNYHSKVPSPSYR